MKPKSRTILITGGSGDMGFELAKRLLVRLVLKHLLDLDL
jgi:NAD(P)-dependent dehydrogenase (short-subunit alcohol dehydrogenase family)